MSAFHVQDQICYVQCGSCNTTLLVNVPWGSLTKVVTVRCGHCTTVFPVNMMMMMNTFAAVPFHLFSTHQETQKQKLQYEEETSDKKQTENSYCLSLYFSSDEEEIEDSPLFNQAAHHKPPEKKQRAPSAYNQFIKEEIKRLKIEYPNMTHKQAFGAAAKNWAHCPQSQSKFKNGEIPGSSEENLKLPMQHYCEADQVHCFGNGFQGTMTLRQPIFSKFPFY